MTYSDRWRSDRDQDFRRDRDDDRLMNQGGDLGSRSQWRGDSDFARREGYQGGAQGGGHDRGYEPFGGSGRTYYGEGRGYDREGQSRMSGYGEERGGRSYQDYAGGGSNDFYGSGGYESNDRGQYQYQRENSGQPQGQFYGGGRYYGGGRDHEWGSNPRSGYGHEGRNWWDKTTDKVQAMFGDDDARRRSQWDSQTGQHRGRGPKGYQRSDERIREDVHDRLTDDHHLDASNIEVMVKDCEITLNGTVSSREDKRRAEDLVESCSGVKHVQNNLRVDPQAGMSQSSGMGGSSMSQASGQKTQGGAGIESNPKLAKAAASRA